MSDFDFSKFAFYGSDLTTESNKHERLPRSLFSKYFRVEVQGSRIYLFFCAEKLKVVESMFLGVFSMIEDVYSVVRNSDAFALPVLILNH